MKNISCFLFRLYFFSRKSAMSRQKDEIKLADFTSLDDFATTSILELIFTVNLKSIPWPENLPQFSFVWQADDWMRLLTLRKVFFNTFADRWKPLWNYHQAKTFHRSWKSMKIPWNNFPKIKHDRNRFNIIGAKFPNLNWFLNFHLKTPQTQQIV